MVRPVRPLLDDQFAPTTWSPGFLAAPIDATVDALSTWRVRTDGAAPDIRCLSDGLAPAIAQLAPLTSAGRPRELLVGMVGGWTAYFDCHVGGTDAVSAVSYLARVLGVRGVAIVARQPAPGAIWDRKMPRSTQFQVFAPHQTQWLNYLRTVSADFDGRTWRFDEFGDPLPFEQVERYQRKAVRDRLDAALIEQYCRAIDLEPFDSRAYVGPAYLIKSSTPLQAGIHLTYAQARARLGIA